MGCKEYVENQAEKNMERQVATKICQGLGLTMIDDSKVSLGAYLAPTP